MKPIVASFNRDVMLTLRTLRTNELWRKFGTFIIHVIFKNESFKLLNKFHKMNYFIKLKLSPKKS